MNFPGASLLTPRELEVLDRLVMHCESNKRAALSLGISPRTVEVHRWRMIERLGVGTSMELALLVHTGHRLDGSVPKERRNHEALQTMRPVEAGGSILSCAAGLKS